ncbi:GNAT family N-acetyltransferase [Lysobacter antibioticus]|uniref:GNAT family N-acetyltransferase n=1 Tax=Lysobacter antibioticus TaxID=84531 RepID=UPI0003493E54|nr:GNAT family N-acetyltransferase [Lysobacter antibioticus]
MSRGGVPVQVELLAAHRSAVPVLQRMFESEWPDYYGGDGPGDAAADLASFCRDDALPLGVVALLGGEAVGVAALKDASIDAYPQFSPWAAAACVASGWRGRGIGAQLIVALEAQAMCLGHRAIYTGTATAGSLMRRLGWEYLDTTPQHGVPVAVFRKRL